MRTILRIGAWLSLISGVGSALYSLIGLGGMSGGIMLISAIATFVSGLVVWALLFTVVHIAEHLEHVDGNLNSLHQKVDAITPKRESKSYSVMDRI